MPLTKVQSQLSRVHAAVRSPDSYMVGGSVLNRVVPRFSGDKAMTIPDLPPGAGPSGAVTEHIDTGYVYTYYVCMNITLSVDDDIVSRARRHAEAAGTSVNRLVRQYLEQLAGKTSPEADAAEFERLSRSGKGDSKGWKFNREDLHTRR